MTASSRSRPRAGVRGLAAEPGVEQFSEQRLLERAVHGAIAEHMQLSATDTRTLELLDRLGPLSAGEIATRTGLAATSVTSLVDRLEARGLVRRADHEHDRRKVVVVRVPEVATRMTAPYAELAQSTVKLSARYSTPSSRPSRSFSLAARSSPKRKWLGSPRGETVRADPQRSCPKLEHRARSRARSPQTATKSRTKR